MQDIRQTPQYATFMRSINWQVVQINHNYIFIKRFPLLGNFIKIQRPPNLSQDFINKVLTNHKPFQILIEPDRNQDYIPINTQFVFRQTSPYLPSKTLILDLTQSKQKLLTQMHPKTRYNIKVAQRKGVTIKITTDINKFATFWDRARYGKSKIIFSQAREIKALYKVFDKNACLLCAYKNQTLVSAIMLLTTKTTAYYMYAASSHQGKALHAPTLATWESIILAKSLGKKYYDFEGLYDHRFPIKSWQGFSKFKKSFGGYEVEYPGAFKKTVLKNFRG